MDCTCHGVHDRRTVVLTGGPGAGKTAVLEMVRHTVCRHVHVLPEAASIVFGGGFPRHGDATCARAAQRAIYHVQRELEVSGAAHDPAVVLCDRGTIDGLAYWPGRVEDFWSATGTTAAAELGRYDCVIHLRTPTVDQGYDLTNPVRIETAAAAAHVDARILRVWRRHPRRYVVESTGEFLDKAAAVLKILQSELPGCCGGHLEERVRDAPAEV